jgi:hypothetical protein
MSMVKVFATTSHRYVANMTCIGLCCAWRVLTSVEYKEVMSHCGCVCAYTV